MTVAYWQIFLLSCHTSEGWYTLFTSAACGTEQSITWGPVTLLPLGKVQRNDTKFIVRVDIFETPSEVTFFLIIYKQNRSNTLTLPIQCTVNVASYRDIAVRITGALRIDTLHAVSIKSKIMYTCNAFFPSCITRHIHAISLLFSFDPVVMTAL